MTLRGEVIAFYCSLPVTLTRHSLRPLEADMAFFKVPRPRLTCGFWNFRDTRTPSGLFCQAQRYPRNLLKTDANLDCAFEISTILSLILDCKKPTE